MKFQVLGPIELWADGQRQDPGSARTRSLLVMLLLAPRAIVPAATLIDRIWDTQPPPKARETLSTYITRLRGVLRQVGEDGQLTARAGGYVLDVDPDAIDLHQFRRLRRQADALIASGDHVGAVELLREADKLWHGQALTGIPGDWAGRIRDGLEDERRAATLERARCELELGRHADLVGELQQLLAQYPLDETLIALQMTALYKSGRIGEALSLYRETRKRLIDEQGTEPGQALTELHQSILRHDPQLTAKPADHRPGQADTTGTLPPVTSEFVGRREELGLLIGGYGDGPTISVIEGMPGVGKTTLAVHVAQAVIGQYPDGALYLNLHAHARPGQAPLDTAGALLRLLQMLAVPVARIPADTGERATLWQAQLSRRRTVVILDDAADADQIRPLLPITGECLVLVTTRARLAGIATARELTLNTMSTSDAITLFRQVAGSGGGVYDDTEIAQAVQLCGHLPLAIQLTASRLAQSRGLGLGELIEELSQSPVRIGSAGMTEPEWFATFDLSYYALGPSHQRFFRRLAISPCTQISLRAAAAIAGATLADTKIAVGALLDRHLLAQAPDGHFRFHDLIRGYATMCATRDDSRADREEAISQLLAYYLSTADRADRVLYPQRRRLPVTLGGPAGADPIALHTEQDAAAWLESEWRDILQAARYARRYGETRRCAELTDVLAEFMHISAYWNDASSAHSLALQACRDLGDPARIAQAALNLSEVRLRLGQFAAALPLAEEAAAIYRSLGDRLGEAEALDKMGLSHQRAGRNREALTCFNEAAKAYREAGDPLGVAKTLNHSGIACWQLGQYPSAMALLQEALSLYHDVGDRRGEGAAYNNLGKMHLHLGEPEAALQAYEKALRVFPDSGGGPQYEAILHHNIGDVHQHEGELELGLVAYRRALAIYRRIGDLADEADILNGIGAIYQAGGYYDEALVHHQKAYRVAEQIGDLSLQVATQRAIATVYHSSGRYSEALGCYQAALVLAKQIGDPYEEAKVLEGIAETTLSMRQLGAARAIFQQALEIFERLGVPEAEVARERVEVCGHGGG